ncbi:MAG: DUF420 domain-containing protein [Nitrospirae bacterium]|nr:MAG: DUF420 domain-containing protein [Nitrospirota bacterium]
MKELLTRPGFIGTAATLGADLSQVMAMLFTGLFIIGWVQARKKMGNVHHWLVLGGMVAMLGFFTSYYLFRQLGVLAFEGRTGFGGSDFMYYKVFLPLLTFHISLVIVGLIMAIYMLILGFRAQQLVAGKRELRPGELKVRQEKLTTVFVVSGAVLLVLYVISGLLFGTGFTLRRSIVYVAGLLVVGLVLGAEKTIERFWPDGGKRHRALGRFTMVIYCILFVTGSVTYTMLYILYPGKIG